MSHNSQQTEAVPPFAPPPGYATAVDAALEWFSTSDFKTADIVEALRLTGPHRFHAQKIAMRAGYVLADEVRRLRGDMIVMRAMVKAGHPIEAIDAVLSHNEKLSGALKKGEPHV